MRYWGAPAAVVFSLLQMAAAFSQGLSAGGDGLSLKNTLETLDQRFNELPAWREGGIQVDAPVMPLNHPIVFLGRWVYLESSFGRTSVAMALSSEDVVNVGESPICAATMGPVGPRGASISSMAPRVLCAGTSVRRTRVTVAD